MAETPTYLSLDDISPSSSPHSRPGLSRTSSVSSMALAEADDSFSQLTLLDLLVALDAHVDLASREIKKKGKEWRNKANSTAISVKRSAGEVISNQRRLRRRVAAVGGGFTSSNVGRKGMDPDSEEYEQGDVVFDRELQRFRDKLAGRLDIVKAKWKDQRVVSLRDKLSFFFGVELVLFSALLIGFRPQWIPGVYTALAAYLFPIRIYEYRKKSYSLFLYDLCYIVNIMTLAYLWIFPSSTKLFVACYCLTHGPLCTAIATWRNSLVFHSVDKVTSLFIHVYPPFVFTVLRHFYPNAQEKYPALKELDSMNVWKSLVFSSVAYLVWQIFYYYGVIVARKEEIEKQGRITSFTYMLSNKRSFIGKTLAKVKPQYREVSFMIGQFVYTIVTMAPSSIWLYDSKILSVLWIHTFFAVSVWNGASFYFKIMSNSKEVASLKKELEALQKEIEGSKTPASVASMSLSEEPTEGLSLGPSAVASPEFGPGDTGASGPLGNAAMPATREEQQQVMDDLKSSTPDTITIPDSISSTTSTSRESDSPLKRDESVPSLRLDDIDAEGSQPSSNNDDMSDSSAIMVNAEDGQPRQ